MNWSTLIAVAALATSSAHAAIIANWKQDELSGPIVDSTGNHPDGIATGVASYDMPGVPNGTYGMITVNGALGSSIEYGPIDQDEFFVVGTTNNNPVMNLDATGAFTVMGWMNPYQLPSATARSYKILSTGSQTGTDRGWGLALRLTALDGTGSSIRFTGFGIADNDSAPFTIEWQTWVHLAVTYNNGLITYFLNGTQLDTDNGVFGNDGAAARLVIGSRLGGNDSDQMNGFLDGIRVYDQVLTETQIREAAAESVSVPEPSMSLLGLAGMLGLMRRTRRR